MTLRPAAPTEPPEVDAERTRREREHPAILEGINELNTPGRDDS
ncbi:MAG TPA: hypothetical protein VGQ92_08925 [Actinoplanes sp.]|jgi:hypothetical protein|nr:hypothetical protein [Actinoplanes sp.]